MINNLSPTFEFDKNVINIRGRCVVEDPFLIWSKFIVEIENYINKNSNLEINFMLEGFNSPTTKYLYRVFSALDKFSFTKKLKVNWIYLETDEDLEFKGQEYKEVCKKLEFNLIPIKDKVQSKFDNANFIDL